MARMRRSLGIGRKNASASLTWQVEHPGDGLALVGDLQRFAVEAPSAAGGTGHPGIRQEVHFDLEAAIALAAFAAAARRVETETPGPVAALFGQSGSLVNNSRIRSNAPVKVAGFERGLRPIGDWSATTHFPIRPSPSIRSWAPGDSPAPWKWRASARRRMSSAKVDLPLPLGPHRQTSRPNGMVTSRFLQVVFAGAADDQRAERAARRGGCGTSTVSPRRAAMAGGGGDRRRRTRV